MAKNEDDKDEKETELTPVGPGAEESATTDEGGEELRGEEDQRDEASDEDERTGHAEEEDNLDDSEREHRREERRKQRRFRKEKYQRDRVELNFLRNRNEQLERRFSELDARTTGTEVSAIDGRITTLAGQIAEAERVQGQAITEGKGEVAAEAARIARELEAQRAQLAGLREQVVNAARERTAAPNRQQAPDQRIVSQAEAWAEAHDWYDPALGDEDSAIAKAVEQRLSNENTLNPRTAAYWRELDRRLAKRLPHLYKGANGNGKPRPGEDDEDDEDEEDYTPRTEQRRRNGGPRITSGGRERPLKRNEVYVSAERKAAMMEAGVWEDSKLRNKYLAQYQKYDREHGRGRH